MEANEASPPKIEAPRGMYPARLDDKGRMKLPAVFQEYFQSLAQAGEKKLFVTSLDRNTAQIYPPSVWRENEEFFFGYKDDPELAENVAFTANELGSESEMDGQGRITFSPELRRELKIENQPVHIYSFKGHIEVLSEEIFLQRKGKASENPQGNVRKLQVAGLK